MADLLVRRFGPSGEEAIDGHPEIETALVELYRLTNEAAYLQLATRFVELRGRGLLGPDRFGANYFQDHAPVREATEPTGHAVRQLYLAAGVTDVYLEGADDTLLAAMEELWENLHLHQDLRHRRARLAPPRRGLRRPLRAAARPRVRRDLRVGRELPVELADAAGHGPRALRRRDGARALQRGRGRDVGRRATASSTPTRCSCAPATTAPTRTIRQGAWSGTAARAARRTSRASSPR